MSIDDVGAAVDQLPSIQTTASPNSPAGGGPSLLSVRSLSKTYNSATPTEKEAIRNISFEAGESELVCVVGPSGAGKTTLLRCLCGLSEPSSGGAFFEGNLIRTPPPEIAVVFQDYSRSLFPWLSVRSNIASPLKNKGVKKKDRDEIVERSLHAVGLPDVGHLYPWQLSGGMQQRVAIARALAYQPKLLLMDEPFASVDAQTRFELEDLVLNVRSQFGMTIIFVTHDIDEAVYVGNRVVVLSASPCIVKRELAIPFPEERNQIATRGDPTFVALRTEILELVTGDEFKRRRAGA